VIIHWQVNFKAQLGQNLQQHKEPYKRKTQTKKYQWNTTNKYVEKISIKNLNTLL
jgi:hypothetical protein